MLSILVSEPHGGLISPVAMRTPPPRVRDFHLRCLSGMGSRRPFGSEGRLVRRVGHAAAARQAGQETHEPVGTVTRSRAHEPFESF